jgi:hypothetical protein
MTAAVHDQSYIPTLIARASAPAQPELKPYKRSDLETLLPEKFWFAVSDHGEPDVNGDPDLQSIAASHCLYVINYVLRHVDDSAKEALEVAAAREGHSACMFLSLARARRAVEVAIDPEPPVPLKEPVPAPMVAAAEDRFAPSMSGLAPMRPFPRFEKSFPNLSKEEESDVLPRGDAGGSDPDLAGDVPDAGGVRDGLGEAEAVEPDTSLVARIAAAAQPLRVGRASVREEAKAKVQRSR